MNFKRFGIRCSGSLFQDSFSEFVWNYWSALIQNSHNKTNKITNVKITIFTHNLSQHRHFSILPMSHPRLELKSSQIKFRIMENYDKFRNAVIIRERFRPRRVTSKVYKYSNANRTSYGLQNLSLRYEISSLKHEVHLFLRYFHNVI